MADVEKILFNHILYSCSTERTRGNENFIAEHSLGYMLEGKLQLQSDKGIEIIEQGSLVLGQRNQLVKMMKIPADNSKFQFISIAFSQDFLHRYAIKNKIDIRQRYLGERHVHLPPDPFLLAYFNSLSPYLENVATSNQALSTLKINEAIELLLQCKPGIKGFLFDFSEPYKIDIEKYMHENFTYNVPISNFATLTGRSLASFKRDFAKAFKVSPRQWLQTRRLSEAYHLIKNKQYRAADIYLDLGFENLTHFYFSFKKRYGFSPSDLNMYGGDEMETLRNMAAK